MSGKYIEYYTVKPLIIHIFTKLHPYVVNEYPFKFSLLIIIFLIFNIIALLLSIISIFFKRKFFISISFWANIFSFLFFFFYIIRLATIINRKNLNAFGTIGSITVIPFGFFLSFILFLSSVFCLICILKTKKFEITTELEKQHKGG